MRAAIFVLCGVLSLSAFAQERRPPPPPPDQRPPAEQPQPGEGAEPAPPEAKTVEVTAQGYNREDALKTGPA